MFLVKYECLPSIIGTVLIKAFLRVIATACSRTFAPRCFAGVSAGVVEKLRRSSLLDVIAPARGSVVTIMLKLSVGTNFLPNNFCLVQGDVCER